MAKIDYELSGVEDVLNWYDVRNGHYFTLHKGSAKIETGDMESREDCRNILLSRLTAMEREGNEMTYVLKIYTKKSKSGLDEKDYKSALPFVVCKPQQNFSTPYYYPQQNAELIALKSELAQLKEWKKQQEEEDENEDGEELGEVPTKPIDQLMLLGVEFLQNPAVKNAAIGFIANLMNPQKKPFAMAGTGTRDEALDILKANGVSDDDLMLLAQMAINNPAQFKMLLKMLRNQ